ncbi:YdcF family protein [Paenibacillus sp. PCH8]|uniref:YdcF family protein n=1 Tax=Paenibacillus sp. PCH8 TaxID=2066524 RepID=UPI000CF86853|nr:YdcF family protein [Paenibacillus sp. PCH8]PQP80693.1 YdcF family protein [Paenibacillus sp. PCH8]
MRSKRNKKRWIIITILVALWMGSTWAGVTAGLILAYTDEDSSRKSDAAIILGAAVERDNPSPVFRERIEHAIELYRQDIVQNLLFTGGSARAEDPAEAEVGRDYAIAHGVDPGDIRIETESRITEENLVHSIQTGEQAGYHTYTIVSDPLHMKRAMKLAKGLGMDAVPSPTRTTAYQTWRSKSPFLARETVMYMGYTIKGWIDNPQQP